MTPREKNVSWKKAQTFILYLPLFNPEVCSKCNKIINNLTEKRNLIEMEKLCKVYSVQVHSLKAIEIVMRSIF